MSIFNKMRLTSLMTFFAIAGVFFSVLLSGAFIIGIISGFQRDDIVSRNNILDDSVAYEANDLIITYQNALSILFLPENRTQRTVDQLCTAFPFFENILILNESGKVILSSGNSSTTGYDMSKRDFFLVPRANNSTYISPSFISKETYHPTVSISVPFSSGVITGFLNRKNLAAHISGLSRETKGTIAITDEAGYYIAHTDIDRVYRRESAAKYPFFNVMKNVPKKSFIIDDFEGKESLVSCNTAKSGGWTIIAAQSTAEIFRSVRIAQLTMFISIIICSSLALFTMIPLLRIVKKNIADLIEGTNRIAAGDYSKKLSYSGFADFSLLVHNFTQMADTLNARETILRDSENNLRRLIDKTPVAMLVEDNNDNVIMMNDKFTELFGYTIKEIPDSSHWWPLAYPDPAYREQIKSVWERNIECGRTGGFDITPVDAAVTCADTTVRFVEIRISTIGIRNIIIFTDFTDRKAAEQKITASEKRYRSVFETAGDAMFIVDSNNGLIIETNSQAEYLYQYSKDEIIKLTIFDLTAEPEKTQSALQKEQVFVPVRYHRKKNGTTFPVEISVNYTELDGRSVLITNIRDISEKHKADERIKANLLEKDLLLKEIHHRVKNNLQIIISLLSLQLNVLKDNESINAFTDSMNRIRVMAAIHEKLYRSDSFAYIDFSEYITMIVSQLLSSYTNVKKRPRHEIDVDHIQLDLDKAVPCGLIINEIITNSLKYAFNESMKDEPVISISMHKNDNTIELIISDNGKGFPDMIDIEKSETLGLKLIIALTRQIRGQYTIERNEGTKWNIRFIDGDNKE